VRQAKVDAILADFWCYGTVVIEIIP